MTNYLEDWRYHPDGCVCRDCQTYTIVEEDDDRTGRSAACGHRPVDVLWDDEL